jgi:hypothetical protein
MVRTKYCTSKPNSESSSNSHSLDAPHAILLLLYWHSSSPASRGSLPSVCLSSVTFPSSSSSVGEIEYVREKDIQSNHEEKKRRIGEQSKKIAEQSGCSRSTTATTTVRMGKKKDGRTGKSDTRIFGSSVWVTVYTLLICLWQPDLSSSICSSLNHHVISPFLHPL